MARAKNIDDILRHWSYDPNSVSVRLCRGGDGRQVLQMRIDMGLLQLEVEGRPDGMRPNGEESYYDYLVSLVLNEGDDFVLDDDQCAEVDREFVQFYHRRICWLKLQEYRQRRGRRGSHVGIDGLSASATLPTRAGPISHEQYRPFVLFHRIQAAALAELEEEGPEAAVHQVNLGLKRSTSCSAATTRKTSTKRTNW